MKDKEEKTQLINNIKNRKGVKAADATQNEHNFQIQISKQGHAKLQNTKLPQEEINNLNILVNIKQLGQEYHHKEIIRCR